MIQSSDNEFPLTMSATKRTASKRIRLLSVLLRAVLPIGLLAIGGGAFWLLSAQPEKEKAAPAAKKALRTRVTELVVQDYPVVIKTNGVVQAHNEVTLSAQVSGQITHVNSMFEAGSYFAAGDVLVELDDRDHKTAVAVAVAQHLGAKSALELAKQDHQRKLGLFRKNSVSEAEVNLAAATQTQAEAQLDSATADVEQAERDLERTKIRAPFDGRVRQKTVGVGQSVGPGTALGVVFAVDFAEVRLPIAGPELPFLDLPELAEDAPVQVELRDAINKASATVWKARIVRTEGALDENSLELFVIAQVDDPFGRKSGHPPLRIGQPVVASMAGKVIDNVVAVPRIAVRQLDRVFLVDQTELTLMARTIAPIWSDEDNVIVRDPLIHDGALLSTTHLVYAPDGSKVEIIPDTELTATEVKANTTAVKTTTKGKPIAN